MNYHLFINGAQEGPMDEAEVRRRLDASEVSAGDQCWAEGWEEWRLIGDWLEAGKNSAEIFYPNPNPVVDRVLQESHREEMKRAGIFFPEMDNVRVTSESPQRRTHGTEIAPSDSASERTFNERPKSAQKAGRSEIDSSDWKITYQSRLRPTPIEAFTEEDRKSAEEALPIGFGGILMAIVCSFGAVLGLALGVLAIPSLIIVSLVETQIGTDYVWPLFFTGWVSTIILTGVIYYNYRNRVYESTLQKRVIYRNHKQNLNFDREESAFIEKAENDTSSCREIATHLVPQQVNRVKNLKLLIEKTTSRAETLFKEGAFTPFWDAVDEVVGQLRLFDELIGEVRGLSTTYYGLLEGRKHNFPIFPVCEDVLPDLKLVFERLETVISKAHRNFQFTQIYEQRKTTSAVLAGFSSLGQAIFHLRSDIVNSVDGLRDSVDSGFRRVSTDIRTLESSQNQNAESLRDVMRSQHREQLDTDKERSAREEKYQGLSDETLRAIRKNTERE